MMKNCSLASTREPFEQKPCVFTVEMMGCVRGGWVGKEGNKKCILTIKITDSAKLVARSRVVDRKWGFTMINVPISENWVSRLDKNIHFSKKTDFYSVLDPGKSAAVFLSAWGAVIVIFCHYPQH